MSARIKTLLSRTITTALTAEVTEPNVSDPLHIRHGADIQAKFTYGSGGTNATFYIQTSLDKGVSWFDIACFQFTTATQNRVVSLSKGAIVPAVTVTTDGSMTANTALDGIGLSRVRVKYTTTGTYAGSTTIVITAQVS